jgi:hypothetical protein
MQIRPGWETRCTTHQNVTQQELPCREEIDQYVYSIAHVKVQDRLTWIERSVVLQIKFD